MQSVAIFPVSSPSGETYYRAVSSAGSSEGRTAGEALDAARAALAVDRSPTFVVIQAFAPDPFFSAAQQARLAELTARKNAVEDGGPALSEAEEEELRALVDAELEAAIRRTQSLLKDLGK